MEWKKETARDILALGSWVFFVLVILRAAILVNKTFLTRLVIAGIVLFILEMIYGDYDKVLSRGLVIAVFTSAYYSAELYTGFVMFLYIGLIMSSDYLGSSGSRIFKGILAGLIALAAGYNLAGLIV